MPFCRFCNLYNYEKACICKPFKVWIDGYCDEDEPWTVHGSNAEEAAKTAADRYDTESAEYSIVSGSPETFHLRGPDGVLSHWLVAGESVPQYTATKRDQEDV